MRNGKPLILCVDDDPDILASMKTVIESDGCVVETAASAEEGLRKYRAERPDFVTVDLMMEEVDSGIKLVSRMRVSGPIPPVYMLSSVGEGLSENVDPSQLGLAGVLQKPVAPQILLGALRDKLPRG